AGRAPWRRDCHARVLRDDGDGCRRPHRRLRFHPQQRPRSHAPARDLGYGDHHRRCPSRTAALRPAARRRLLARGRPDHRRDRSSARDVLSGPCRQSLHRLRTRRSRARRLRHPGGDPPRLSVRTPARRRPRPARGHAGRDDARRRRVGPSSMTARGDRGSRDLKVRVRGGKSRTLASRLWLERQLNDPYVARAKREGFRSRAAYKLIEIDDKFRIFKPCARVVDLGAAPGGWSQVAARRVGAGEGQGRVVAIDLLEMDAIGGVEALHLDFLNEEAPARLKDLLGGPADVVLSDMAANATGHRKTDHLKIMALAETAALFAREVLTPGGTFLCKVLQGGTEGALLTELKRDFATVKHVKPAASRSDSAELYVLAMGFREGSR